MITPVLLHTLGNLLATLVNSAARTLALGFCAGTILTVFRVKNTSLHLFTWTGVLYAALAMPLLGWMLPATSVSLPAPFRDGVSPRAAAIQNSFRSGQSAQAAPVQDRINRGFVASIASNTTRDQISIARTQIPPAAKSLWRAIRWSTVATVVYLLITLTFLVRFLVGLAVTYRLAKRSHAIHDSSVVAKVVDHASANGLSFVPGVAESNFISVPVTIGAFRSAILFPADWREWDDSRMNAVIAHEMSHVARHDALHQRLSLLHRAIFWFSPLAWWLDRHLANLAETASDEAALSSGADRAEYAKTLLDFFKALQVAPGRVRWQGVAMAKAGQAEERVDRILAWKGNSMCLKKSIAIIAVAVALPMVYLAASVRAETHDQNQNAFSPRAESAAPMPAISTRDHAAPAILVSRAGQTVPAVPPVAPVAPVAKTGDMSVHSSSHIHIFSDHYDDDEMRFVIVTAKSDSLTMSGSRADIRHVEKLKKQIAGDFIWFQNDEKSYVIRDQATIDRARALWAPQDELGKKQEALGEQQEVLGKQQEALGEKMQQVQVKVPDLSAEMQKLQNELKKLNSGATMEQVGELQSEIGELQSRIGDIQSAAGDQQGKLGEEMGALGEKQGKLGEQQGELGRQQGELAEQASRDMKKLLDEAITKGTAHPEPQTAEPASL